MTEPTVKNKTRLAVESRLGQRYRAELRFRSAGIAAIFISVAVLVFLIGSIAKDGVSAFSAYQLKLPVNLAEELVDPNGDGSEQSLRRGSYSRILQNSMREEFPEVSGRRNLRSLFQLYTALNSTRLMDQVLADPALVGTEYVFQLPIADDLDLYLKGMLVEDRTLPVSGTLNIEPGRRDLSLQSAESDFLELYQEIHQSLIAEATGLELRSQETRHQASLAESDEAERLTAQADGFDARAEALRAEANAPDGMLRLTSDMPSIIVETAESALKLTGLGSDGRSAQAEIVLGEAAQIQTPDWSVYVIDTPEARRRILDQQIIWTRALVERGLVEKGFNSLLFANADSREPELAGVKGALYGSILTMIITLALSMPIGVFTAVYLEEYAPKNKLTDLIEVNINNLAAVPSIVFGLLGLAVFINMFGMPRSAPLLGGLVLSLMTLPTIIIATRAALKAVPPSIRQAALGVGASQTQAVFHHVLPLAAPGILTGSIIGLARALGETAPLLMIGMVAFIADAPTLGLEGFTQPATVMPVQIFLWYDGAERAFEARTAAAILILLGLMISFNALAVYLRRKFERRW